MVLESLIGQLRVIFTPFVNSILMANITKKNSIPKSSDANILRKPTENSSRSIFIDSSMGIKAWATKGNSAMLHLTKQTIGGFQKTSFNLKASEGWTLILKYLRI